MSNSEFSWRAANGLKILAQEWKPSVEARGAVALVHGLGEHSGRYEHVAAALNQAGYALIGFDLPGHGKSGGTRGHSSYEEIMVEIDHLLQETSQRYTGKPRFLYGHSLGGALVLYYTLKRRPDLCGVIATSPGLAPGTPVRPSKLFLAKMMARIYPAFKVNNDLDISYLSHDPEIKPRYAQDPLVHPYISARLGLDLLTMGKWIQEHAPEFSTPLLLMQGSQDPLVSPQATAVFASAVPENKITYKVWEGYYHETHNETGKAQVLQFMIDWLDQHI